MARSRQLFVNHYVVDPSLYPTPNLMGCDNADLTCSPSPPPLALLLPISLSGVYLYVVSNGLFQLDNFHGYAWVNLYSVMICYEMIYGKKITELSTLESTWSYVYYTNLYMLAPLVALGVSLQEHTIFMSEEGINISPAAVGIIIVASCVGLALSFLSWWLRSQLTATTFTLMGSYNKFFTVLAWHKNVTPADKAFGAAAVIGSLVSGLLYRESTVRGTPETAKSGEVVYQQVALNDDDMEVGKDLELRGLIQSAAKTLENSDDIELLSDDQIYAS